MVASAFRGGKGEGRRASCSDGARRSRSAKSLRPIERPTTLTARRKPAPARGTHRVERCSLGAKGAVCSCRSRAIRGAESLGSILPVGAALRARAVRFFRLVRSVSKSHPELAFVFHHSTRPVNPLRSGRAEDCPRPDVLKEVVETILRAVARLGDPRPVERRRLTVRRSHSHGSLSVRACRIGSGAPSAASSPL